MNTRRHPSRSFHLRPLAVCAVALAPMGAIIPSTAAAETSSVLPCGYGKAGFKDPRCNQTGAVGSGPSLAQAGTAARISGGFLAGSKLTVSFADVFDTAKTPLRGAIWEVDTRSGARRVVSGFAHDAAGSQWVGAGEQFGSVWDVKPATDGYWALSRRPNATVGKDEILLFKVTRDGTRSIAMSMSAAGAPCRAIGQSLSVAADGTIYATYDFDGTERGLMKVDPSRKACTVVSSSPSNGGKQAPVGAGPGTSTLRTVLAQGGALYATDFLKAAVFKVDPTTGARTILSSANPAGLVGPGVEAIGTGYLAIKNGRLLVTGTLVGGSVPASAPGIMAIDMTSGARSTFGSGDGILAGRDQIMPIWDEPGTEDVLVAVGKSIVRYRLGGDRNYVSSSF